MSRLTFENRRDYPSCRDQLFFYLGRDFSVETLSRRDFCRDCRDLSRRVEIFKICRDAVKICREISSLSRPFESENDEKS